MGNREAAIGRAHNYFDDGGFFADLARRVAIPTESQEARGRAHLDAYLAAEIKPSLEKLGFRCEIMNNPVASGGPFLVAERVEDPALPTVLSYGHGDVIRGLEAQWRDGIGPWQLKREGERWYGRGTADNKGQHSINFGALAAVLATRGSLGFNIRILVETGEEIGSPGLKEFCAVRAARSILISASNCATAHIIPATGAGCSRIRASSWRTRLPRWSRQTAGFSLRNAGPPAFPIRCAARLPIARWTAAKTRRRSMRGGVSRG
jgi:acetylornithine deacetylase/succinyl-diaminopimelate desuccinylase-like protein